MLWVHRNLLSPLRPGADGKRYLKGTDEAVPESFVAGIGIAEPTGRKPVMSYFLRFGQHVNRRLRVTPSGPNNSTTYYADRRRDPMPIYNLVDDHRRSLERSSTRGGDQTPGRREGVRVRLRARSIGPAPSRDVPQGVAT